MLQTMTGTYFTVNASLSTVTLSRSCSRNPPAAPALRHNEEILHDSAAGVTLAQLPSHERDSRRAPRRIGRGP